MKFNEWFWKIHDAHPYLSFLDVAYIVWFLINIIPFVYLPMQAVRSGFSIEWAFSELFRLYGLYLVLNAIILFGVPLGLLAWYLVKGTRKHIEQGAQTL